MKRLGSGSWAWPNVATTPLNCSPARAVSWPTWTAESEPCCAAAGAATASSTTRVSNACWTGRIADPYITYTR